LTPSQQEDAGSGTNAEVAAKWGLGNPAFAALLKCLRDDNDEVLKHYAAKTVENILAVGSTEFQRKVSCVCGPALTLTVYMTHGTIHPPCICVPSPHPYSPCNTEHLTPPPLPLTPRATPPPLPLAKLITLDLADRLLALSQHGKGEGLQGTCGMALFHLLMKAMTNDPTPKSRPNSSSSSSSGVPGGGVPGGGDDANGDGSGGGNSHVLGSPSSTGGIPGGGVPGGGVPTPGAGARFVVRVLEAGTMAAVVEPLRDGCPRLQQASLNLLNLIFTTDLKVFIAATAAVGGEGERESGRDSGTGHLENAASARADRAQTSSSTTHTERVAVDSAFRSTRQFFLGSTALPSSLGE
jgi:hypothetical protein